MNIPDIFAGHNVADFAANSKKIYAGLLVLAGLPKAATDRLNVQFECKFMDKKPIFRYYGLVYIYDWLDIHKDIYEAVIDDPRAEIWDGKIQVRHTHKYNLDDRGTVEIQFDLVVDLPKDVLDMLAEIGMLKTNVGTLVNHSVVCNVA